MKASNQDFAPPVAAQQGENAPPSGLRERQKLARYERILASAKSLFNRLDFDNTTMAAIADHAEVSTPTVFNYFRSKDELLLALVLQVHHETQASVRNFQLPASGNLADAICEFLAMYSKTSLKTINRKTWRYVEATGIRMPDSDFVKKYDALTREMVNDFCDFLVRALEREKLDLGVRLKPVAEIMFNHWSRLFVELVRNDATTLEDHTEQLRHDLNALLVVMKRAG